MKSLAMRQIESYAVSQSTQRADQICVLHRVLQARLFGCMALEYISGGHMPLTDTGIKGLKPKETRYLVTDGRGLCLEVLPSGKLSWLYRYRFSGRPEKVVIGRYPDMSLKPARGVRDKLAALLATGRSPAQEKRLAKCALASSSTMQEFAERYYCEVVVRDRKDPSEYPSVSRQRDSAIPWQQNHSRRDRCRSANVGIPQTRQRTGSRRCRDTKPDKAYFRLRSSMWRDANKPRAGASHKVHHQNQNTDAGIIT